MKKYRNICIALLAVVLLVSGILALVLKGGGEQRPDNTPSLGIIKSVGSADTLRVSPGEEITLLVVAKNGAEVYVKWGAERFDATKPTKDEEYSAYLFRIKIPASAEAVESMGEILAVASLDGQTEQLAGPEVITVTPEDRPQTTKETEPPVYDIENYNPTYIDTAQQVKPVISDAISKATTNSYTAPYTGNQIAVVTADRADTKPLNSESDYVPYYPTFAKGTMDFVVGESSSIDEDEGTTYYYYDLASGVKVKRDSVTLQPGSSMPENTLKLNSVYASGGELTMRFESTWKVPYFVNLENQYYHTSHGKLFNVTDFTATGLSITFNYTTSASGEIDCKGSNVVSDCSWSLSPENKTATLRFNFRQAGQYYGYSFYYEGNETVLTLKRKPKGLAGSVVVLDPGHGFDDAGATGLGEAVYESDINILIAYQVKTALEQQGVTVYMTRYANDDINLEGRKIVARNLKADLFVSIHANGSTDKTRIGTSAYYYKPFSMSLASDIYYELLAVYRNNLYASQPELYEDIAGDVRYYPFSVTRLDECPSALVEVGYLTNDAECYMLTRTENQQLIGQAIARGIISNLTR